MATTFLYSLPLMTMAVISNAKDDFVSFGIVTDLHYADANPSGTRIYRDSLPKVCACHKQTRATSSLNCTP